MSILSRLILYMIVCLHHSTIINITAAWAVDREFFYIFWVAWAPFASLWLPSGCPWAPLGCPRAALGSPWASLGCPWAHLGCPWAPSECPWLPLGCAWASFGRPWVSLEIPGGPPQKKVAQVPRLRTRSSLREFARRSRWSRGNGVMKCCSDPPSTRAGGQDYVSFTNSLK